MSTGTDLRETDSPTSCVPLRVSEDVLFRAVDGEAIVLELQSGRYYGFDEIGSRIWSLLCEGLQLPAISASLVNEYDATEERIEGDVARFVARLSELGLVTVEPAASPVPKAAE